MLECPKEFHFGKNEQFRAGHTARKTGLVGPARNSVVLPMQPILSYQRNLDSFEIRKGRLFLRILHLCGQDPASKLRETWVICVVGSVVGAPSFLLDCST